MKFSLLVLFSNLILISCIYGQNQNKLSDSELIKKYSQLVREDSTNYEAYHDLGIILLHSNRINDAKNCFKRMIILKPNDPLPYYYMGFIFEQMKEYYKSIEWYHKTIGIDSLFEDVYFHIGLNYAIIHNYDKSIYYIKKYLKLNPKSFKGHKCLGQFYLFASRNSLAVKEFKNLIKIRPEDPEIYFMLYLAYERMNNQKEALKYLKEAVSLAPNKIDYNGKKYMDVLKLYTDRLENDEDRSYTQVVSNVCCVNFPEKPEDRSDVINKRYIYRLFDKERGIIYLIKAIYLGHYDDIFQNKIRMRGFLAGMLKGITRSKVTLCEPKISDYNILYPGIKQRFETKTEYDDGELDQIVDMWLILHKKKKTLIEIVVTRLLFNYDENAELVDKFYKSLKIYD